MEAIEHADTTNEHGKLLIEPMNELEIGKDVSLMRIVKVLYKFFYNQLLVLTTAKFH